MKIESSQQSKWIAFLEQEQRKDRKTKTWNVVTKEAGEGFLGEIKWFGRWRRYCFFPAADTVYEEDCLRDIAAFCERETACHKARQQTLQMIKGVPLTEDEEIHEEVKGRVAGARRHDCDDTLDDGLGARLARKRDASEADGRQ